MTTLVTNRRGQTAPQAPGDTDGSSPFPCHEVWDARTGGVHLCTRPLGHGGAHVDRVNAVTKGGR